LALAPETHLAPAPVTWWVGDCTRIDGHFGALRVSSLGELLCVAGCAPDSLRGCLGVQPWESLLPVLRGIKDWHHDSSSGRDSELFSARCPMPRCDSEVLVSIGTSKSAARTAVHHLEIECGAPRGQ
jgi:hypothetical protein